MKRRQLLTALPAIGVTPLAAATEAVKKARLRSAICAYSFREALRAKTMTYDDLVRLAADLGVDGLDLTVYWFPTTSDDFLAPLRRLAYKLAVEIYSISVRTEMCRPKAEDRQAELMQIAAWLEVAQKLGAGHIRVFGGRVPQGATEDQAAGWAAEVLRSAADLAAKKGVVLGLENHGGITARADRVIQIVRQVDSPWVGVNVDTGNFESEPYEQVEKLIPYAVNVQLKTEVRLAPKQTAPSDWNRFIQMLAKSGYRGYVALEYEGKEDAMTAVPRLMGELRRLLAAST